ncbi:MAG: alpha/beta hydrolase [Leptospira sp.]|jgi:acetyl esterase|nr:alpha/beta hydrolase [Leptospira sp.]
MKIINTIQRSLLRLLIALPDSWKLKFVGGERLVIQDRELDLDLHIVCKLSKFNPDISSYPPPKARIKFNNSMQVLTRLPISLPKVETTIIGKGAEALKIRFYNPDPTRDNHPILVYFHGGGFTVGNIDTVDEVCRRLAYRTPCMVFSVNYRLAPEFPFPYPLDDCYRAYNWIRNNAYRLGANPEKIAVAGDSAGGNLALGVTRKLHENRESLPNFMGLIYPVADMSKESSSYETFQDGFLLTRKMMRWFHTNYTSKPEEQKDPLVSPLLAQDFPNFPPAYVSTAGFDPLGDEGRELVSQMAKSGVRVTHSDFPGLVHGYFNMGSIIPSCREAIEDFIKFLKTEWST